MSRLTDAGVGVAKAFDIRAQPGASVDTTISPVVVVEDTRFMPYRPGRREVSGWGSVTALAGQTGNLLVQCTVPQVMIVELTVWHTAANAIMEVGKYTAVGYQGTSNQHAHDRISSVRAIPPNTSVGLEVVSITTGAGAPDIILERVVTLGNTPYQLVCCVPFLLKQGDLIAVRPTALALTYGVNVKAWWDE